MFATDPTSRTYGCMLHHIESAESRMEAARNAPQHSHMDGVFAHRHVRMDWTLDGGNHEWLLAVSFGDVGVTRQYPEVLTRVEAEERGEQDRARIVPHGGGLAEVVPASARVDSNSQRHCNTAEDHQRREHADESRCQKGVERFNEAANVIEAARLALADMSAQLDLFEVIRIKLPIPLGIGEEVGQREFMRLQKCVQVLLQRPFRGGCIRRVVPAPVCRLANLAPSFATDCAAA